jgi:uncharacterized protein involved in exopolysaccharide biosynthesis
MTQLPEESKNDPDISLEATPKAEGNIVKFYLNILKRNILLITIFSILGLLGAWFASREDPIVYVGRFEILVEPVTSEQKLTDPAVLARSQGVLRDNLLEVDYPTILKILKSPLLLNNIAADLHSLYPKISQDFILQNLQKDLSVQRVQQGSSRLDFTKIIEVTFQSSNPKFTESVLKVAAENFLEYSKQERENSLESGKEFIDSQIPKIKKKITEIQNQQETLQKKYNLVDPRATGNALVETHLLAGQKIVNLQSEINELSILSRNLQKKLGLTPAQALLASKLSQNPERQKLLSQLYQVEADISLKSQSLSPKHPTLVKLMRDKANLENLIQQVTKSIITSTNNLQPINKKVLEFQDGYQLSLIRELVEVQNKIDSLSFRYKTLLDEQEKLNQNLKNCNRSGGIKV